jgi:DNA replication and repair protein RecF
MHLNRLILTNFRNFHEKTFFFGENGIVFEGKNGIGKTNVLEAIYLLCTGKSQRKSKRIDMINFDSDYFYIEGNFFFDSQKCLDVALGFGKEKKTTFILDNNTTNDFIKWFDHRPVMSFSSEDIFIVYGSPDCRRKFLDLFGSLIDSSYLQLVLEYRYWLTRKNHLLHNKFNVIQCEIYDDKIAQCGTELIFKRSDLIGQLKLYFSSIYKEISGNSDCVDIFYESSPNLGNSSKNFGKNVFYNILCDHRNKDRISRFSSFGPHRDDFQININGRDAKQFSSQGQCRSLSLALKISSSMIIENICKEHIIYLVDDTVSELDSFRTEHFFPLIQNRGQIFLTAPQGKLSYCKDFQCVNISVDH